MGYFNRCLYHSANKEHAKYGTVGSTSSEKGTDNKKNNTSQYNHDYYMKNKEKWEGKFDYYKDGDKDFDDSNYSEKNQLGDTDFYGWQKEDGSWVILEEDMKFTLPKGMSREEIISRLEAYDKEIEAKLQRGEKHTHEDWVNGAKKALSSKSSEKEFDVDAAARDVIRGKYKNGAERKAALGDDYAEVQKRVNELMKGQKSSSKKTEEKTEESKAPETKKDDEVRNWNQVREDYNKKKMSLKHSDDWGSVLVRDLY